MIRIGVIGYGYWGPNVVRNFHTHEDSEVVLVCDKSSKAEPRLKKAHPSIAFTTDPSEVLKSPNIDLVAVVTPVWTHYELAKAALQNGKHVFVEKPFTCSVVQAEELVELAERKNLQIMVDHTFLFTGAVKKIRQLVEEGALGDRRANAVKNELVRQGVATGEFDVHAARRLLGADRLCLGDTIGTVVPGVPVNCSTRAVSTRVTSLTPCGIRQRESAGPA